ncbi:MAG: hypothetical protein SchgKO_02370 [Schleiferiaceae bacterium]
MSQTYYSVQNGNWEDLTTWSTSSSSTVNPATPPTSATDVIIRNTDTVLFTAAGAEANSVEITTTAVLDIVNFAAADLGTVTGDGTLRVRQADLPTADYTSFNSSGTVELYNQGSNRSFTGINFTCYNLRIRLVTNNRLTLTGTISVNNNVDVYSDVNVAQDIRMQGLDLTVENNLTVHSGDFMFRNQTAASNVLVKGDITVETGRFQCTGSNLASVTHSLEVQGSIVANNTFDMYNGTTRYVDVQFTTVGNESISGTGTVEFREINLNKGTDTTSSLTIENTGNFTTRTNPWLNPTNGMFIYNRTANKNLNTTTNDFTLPATCGIKLSSTGRLRLSSVNDNDGDMKLEGYLICENGELQMGNTARNANNDIFYDNTGNATIIVRGTGVFTVNGSLCRDTLFSTGSLSVIVKDQGRLQINGRQARSDRGVLEITSGGNLTVEDDGEIRIIRAGTNGVPDVVLNPSTSSFSSGLLSFIPANNISTTEENLLLDCSIPVHNLTITGNSGDLGNLTLEQDSLTVTNDFTITNTNSTFDATDKSVTVGGNVNLTGACTWSNSTLSLTGVGKTLSGTVSGASALDNLALGSNATYNFTPASISALGNISLDAGSELDFDDNTFVVDGVISGAGSMATSLGDLTLQTSGATALPGFTSGKDTLDLLTINRTAGSVITSQGDLKATRLALTSGVWDLQNATAELLNGYTITGTHSNQAMIATSGTGQLKAGITSAGTYNFPFGDVTGTAEYSPIEVVITSATFGGSSNLSIAVSNSASAQCPGSTSLLNRIWTVGSEGITDVNARVNLTYVDADIVGTESDIRGVRYNGSFCVNGDEANVANNTLSVYSSAFGEYTGKEIQTAPLPTASSSSWVVNGVTKTTLDFGWTSGDGAQRLVVMREGGAITWSPSNNTYYTANASFGSGTAFDADHFIVGKGTLNSLEVTNLDPNRNYYVEVIEFNKQDTLSQSYRTSDALSENQNTRVELDLAVAFNGPLDEDTGLMTTDLNSGGYLPLAQPFNNLPIPYTGTETVVSIPANVSDWVMVELYDAQTEGDMTLANRVYRGAFFVLNDGSIVDMDGSSNPVVLANRGGQLRPLIRHRNHLPVVSADTLSNSGDIHAYDFKTSGGASISPTITVGSIEVVPGGRVVLMSNSQSIDADDYTQVLANRTTTAPGYSLFDVTWDGIVSAADRAKVSDNRQATVSTP